MASWSNKICLKSVCLRPRMDAAWMVKNCSLQWCWLAHQWASVWLSPRHWQWAVTARQLWHFWRFSKYNLTFLPSIGWCEYIEIWYDPKLVHHVEKVGSRNWDTLSKNLDTQKLKKYFYYPCISWMKWDIKLFLEGNWLTYKAWILRLFFKFDFLSFLAIWGAQVLGEGGQVLGLCFPF